MPNFHTLNITTSGSLNLFSGYDNLLSQSGFTTEVTSQGKLIFKEKSYGLSDLDILQISSSDREPRVGIGFSKSDSFSKTFDLLTTKDDTTGTEILLRSSRTTTGAETGDEAGKITFAINSASFKSIDVSGSVANIVAKVTDVNEQGVLGKLIFNTSNAKGEAPYETLVLAYGQSTFSSSLNVLQSLNVTQNVSSSLSKANSLVIGNVSNLGTNNANIAGNLKIGNNITASGNISSSGTILSNKAIVNELTASGKLLLQGEVSYNTPSNPSNEITFYSNAIDIGGGSFIYEEGSHPNFKYFEPTDSFPDRSIVVLSGSLLITGSTTITGPLIITGSQLITQDISSDGTIRARVKSFDIPHPTRKGKRLVYGALEGPEHGIYCRGESKELKVLLPSEWRAMVNKKTISVQITPIGEWQPIYFKKFESNWIHFGCGDNRETYHFYWEIKGERTDVPKLETIQ
jgi:hypothetical protein